MVLPWFDAASFVRPRTRSWLGDAPTVVFVDQPLNGEKSPTMGKDLQFCRPNLMMNGFIDVEDLTPVLARWCFLAEV